MAAKYDPSLFDDAPSAAPRKKGRPAVYPPTNQGSDVKSTMGLAFEKAKQGAISGLMRQPIDKDLGSAGGIGGFVGQEAPLMAGASAAVGLTGATGLGAVGAAGLGAGVTQYTRSKLLEVLGQTPPEAQGDLLADAAQTGLLYATGDGAMRGGAQLFKSTIKPFIADAFPSIMTWMSHAVSTATQRVMKNPALMQGVETIKDIPEHTIINNMLTAVDQGRKFAQQRFKDGRDKFVKHFGNMTFDMQGVLDSTFRALADEGAAPGLLAKARKAGLKVDPKLYDRPFSPETSLTEGELSAISKHLLEPLQNRKYFTVEDVVRMRERMVKEFGLKYDDNIAQKLGSKADRIVKGAIAQMKDVVRQTEANTTKSSLFADTLEEYAETIGIYEDLSALLSNKRAKASIVKAFRAGEGTPEWEMLNQLDQRLGIGHRAFGELLDTLAVKQFTKRVHPEHPLNFPRAAGRTIQYGVPLAEKAEGILGAIMPDLTTKAAPAVLDSLTKENQRRRE